MQPATVNQLQGADIDCPKLRINGQTVSRLQQIIKVLRSAIDQDQVDTGKRHGQGLHYLRNPCSAGQGTGKTPSPAARQVVVQFSI